MMIEAMVITIYDDDGAREFVALSCPVADATEALKAFAHQHFSHVHWQLLRPVSAEALTRALQGEPVSKDELRPSDE